MTVDEYQLAVWQSRHVPVAAAVGADTAAITVVYLEGVLALLTAPTPGGAEEYRQAALASRTAAYRLAIAGPGCDEGPARLAERAVESGFDYRVTAEALFDLRAGAVIQAADTRRVFAPDRAFTGAVVGVAFAYGVGETNSPTALAYFTRRGYEIRDLVEGA